MSENTLQGAENAPENLTISQADYDTAIAKAQQSGEDKVRGELSKKIRQLEAKNAELSKLLPAQKSEAELALEKRLADLETRQIEIDAKERKLNLQTALTAKGLDAALIDYLRDGVDVEAFTAVIRGVVETKMKSNGFVPSGHQANQGLTKADFDKLSYIEKAELWGKNPDLIKKFL